jgi:hypothetical protein
MPKLLLISLARITQVALLQNKKTVKMKTVFVKKAADVDGLFCQMRRSYELLFSNPPGKNRRACPGLIAPMGMRYTRRIAEGAGLG